MTTLTESIVESAALGWLAGLGWQVVFGPDIAPDTPGAERADYGQVVLERQLRDSLARLNPSIPASTLEDAFLKLTRLEGATLEVPTIVENEVTELRRLNLGGRELVAGLSYSKNGTG